MKTNSKITFDITRSLFAILTNDRQEIALSGVHVLLLTECFFGYLPFFVRMKIDREELFYGALLHDIGKIGIPKEVLNKAGKLEQEERESVKKHAEFSAKILENINGLGKVAGWIKYHHERMDGGGYYHLKGGNIPVEARILAITDAYSSIVMASSFKPSRTYEDAVSILAMGAGTQFDRELIDVFLSIPPQMLNDATNEAAQIIKHSNAWKNLADSDMA